MANNDYADLNLSSYDIQATPDNKDAELQATRFNFAKFQLQRKNHFQVQFLPSKYDPSLSIDPELRFMLKSFPLPKETTEAQDINYFNQTIKVAGKTTFESFTMVLRDSIGFDVERKFLDWRDRVYDPRTGRMGLAAMYKLDAMVYEFTPNRDYYRAWKCEGCFPSGVDYGDMDYDDGGEKQIQVTLSVDRAYRDDLQWNKTSNKLETKKGRAPISDSPTYEGRNS